MDEQEALARLADVVSAAGDDAAIVDGLVITTDMLHASTDFPDGTTPYTAGWRAVGASLSDVAAMGASDPAAVAAYGAPEFDWDHLGAFLDGAVDVCEAVGGEYVGGDLDGHDEFTVATTAIGRIDDPVRRSGATPGEAVCVTGSLGRSGAALRLFRAGETERANDLFRFRPRIAAGETLAAHASAMLDSSDGLARSLHQLADASDCGVAIESPLPIDPVVDEVAADEAERLELGAFFGEDFELVCTLPPDRVSTVQNRLDVPLSVVGTVTEESLTLDGEPLPDRGFTH
jgi:thiamine-monophosphate kinase